MKTVMGLVVVVMMAAVALVIPAGTVAVWATNGLGECQAGEYWVRAAADGGIVWLTRARDVGCRWDGTTPALINPAGDCGRAADAEPRWMVYSHNWACDAAWCPHGLEIGGESAWPDLPIGSGVTLCVDGMLWKGRVTAQIWDAGAAGILPQTEFRCGGAACGTLTTCAGMRAQGQYNISRIVFWRAR